MPVKTNLFIKLRNLFLRQILRGFFVFNRRNLIKFPHLRTLTLYIEKFFPICTIDTGYKLAALAGQGKISGITFQALYPDKLPSNLNTNTNNALSELANQYEIYSHKDEIILTHQYGSQNFLLKTARGFDRQYWLKLIKEFEE